MSTDSSDSAYDLAPVPRERPRSSPPPIPEPVPLTYERKVVMEPPAPVKSEPARKLSASEHLFYWLRRLGCVAIMGLGALWLIFIDHSGFWGMTIGCAIIGIGFALLVVAGPSVSEKRGYHF